MHARRSPRTTGRHGRRTVLAGLVALGTGCLDRGADDSFLPEPTRLLQFWAYVYTGDDAVDAIDAVPAADERFDGVAMWQAAFDEIEALVRYGDDSVNDADRRARLVEEDYDDPDAREADEVWESIPGSGADSDYPAGTYVQQTVDGEPVVSDVVRVTEQLD